MSWNVPGTRNVGRSIVAIGLVAASVQLAQAQGTKTRDQGQYSAHAQVGAVAIGADLWGHYAPVEGMTIDARDYLVVEVAFFAPPSTKVEIRNGQFALKVNGERLLPQSSGLVTVKYRVPEMREQRARLETEAQVGPVIVATGRDPVQPRFPGDNNPANVPPLAPTTPEDTLHAPVDPVHALNDAALPEGAHATPISGYLFFAYSGKLKRIKHVELEWTDTTGTATLALK